MRFVKAREREKRTVLEQAETELVSCPSGPAL